VVADDVAVLVVDVVVGAGGQDPNGDGVVARIVMSPDDGEVADGEILEDVALVGVQIALDLHPVLLPQAVGHDLTADAGLALRPGLLHDEERPLHLFEKGLFGEAGVVAGDGGQARFGRLRAVGRRGAAGEKVPSHRVDRRLVVVTPFLGRRRGRGARHGAQTAPTAAQAGPADPEHYQGEDDDHHQDDPARGAPSSSATEEEEAATAAEAATATTAPAATTEAMAATSPVNQIGEAADH
jgi:hypothetical protein